MSKAVKHGIFLGMSTIDIVYSVAQFPAPNSKVSAETQDVFIGGPATNAAIAFHHLGGKASLVTVVGHHPLTGLLREEFRRHEITLIDLAPEYTGVPVISSISVNPAGERNIVSANAHGVIIPETKVDESVLATASVLLLDGHYMPAAQAWASAARNHGIEVVLDGGSWKSGTDKLLETVTTAVCSADFLPPRCSTEDDAIAYLKSRGVPRIAITRGANTIHFASANSSGYISVPQVEKVDTMGAGDIFHGSFCYYFASGLSFEESLRRAAIVAAESCRYRGTREWMQHVSAKTESPALATPARGS